jgi:hypothetical protein
MELASGLMDSIGERLTGSPNMKRANDWTRDKLTEMGLSNAHLEAWGPFGRGWANQYVNARMTSPDITPLIVYAKAWTPGTNGVVTGKCIRANIEDRKDFEKYRGKLAGMIVIFGPDAEVKPIVEPPYKRLADDDLAKIGEYQIPGERPPFRLAEMLRRRQFIKDLNQFFADEKVLAVIDHSRGTSGGGTVFARPPPFPNSPWLLSNGTASPACWIKRRTWPSNLTSPMLSTMTIRCSTTQSLRFPAPTGKTKSSCSAPISTRGTPAPAPLTTAQAVSS